MRTLQDLMWGHTQGERERNPCEVVDVHKWAFKSLSLSLFLSLTA